MAIWLVDERRESLSLTSSTFLSEARGRELEPSKTEALEVLGYFEGHPEPVDFEAAKPAWAVALRKMHPSEFINGGDRVCSR